MAHRRRRRSKRWLGKVLFLVLIIVAGVVCYLVWDNYFRDKTPEKPGDNSKETTKVEEVKKSEPEQETEVVEKEKVKQYEGEDPNVADDLTGVVTYAGVNGNELMIRVNIDQYLAGGSCKLTLLQDGAAVYSDTAEIIDSASTATCAGFNVPVANLSSGETGIRIELDASGKRGVIAGEVEL